MKKCTNCNKEYDDSTAFCPGCGGVLTPIASPGMNNQNSYQQPNYQQADAQLPMKWWKFLVYFALFASAVVSILNGIAYMTGSQYGGYGSLVYEFYGSSLKVLDVIYGLICICIAIWAILTRQSLYGFKQNGPKMLLILYVLNPVVTILYIVLATVVTGISTGDLVNASASVSVVVPIIMVIVNKIYFDKRASMFVN